MLRAIAMFTIAAFCAVVPSASGEGRGMKKASWGKTAGGEVVDLYTLTNAGGASVAIGTYGGSVQAIRVQDKAGALGDVALGFDSLDGYLTPHPFFGALVGRYGNRIGQAKFVLDGHTYTLAKNNGDNSLHGGTKGFDKYVWTARDVSTPAAPGVELTHVSPDGDEGFPGTLTAKVTYTWTDANELRIDYVATTDKPTVVNLTNHSYFNLAGAGNGDILQHRLQVMADRFTPVDKGLITTGELKPVAGTPFDFRQPTAIGARIDAAD